MKQVSRSKYITKQLRLSKIKISKEFEAHLPRPAKFRDKYSYYWNFHLFSEPIVINKKKELIDGYTTYLLCKMLGNKKVVVQILNEEGKSNE